MGYLDLLASFLASGVSCLGDGFRRAQASYATAQQLPDGGFPGRRGGSDIYYTDFALRTLALLSGQPEDPVGSRQRGTSLSRPRASPVGQAAGYLSSLSAQPTDLVQSFSLLNSARLLRRAGASVALDTEAILGVVHRQALSEGGFARPGGSAISAYNTFIAALCLEMLGKPLHDAQRASAAVADLQGPEGGFREQPGEGMEQTNATAAAMTFLMMTAPHCRWDRLPAGPDPDRSRWRRDRTIRFLSRMQAPDGGLLAHAQASQSDLLSTFTGLLTLATMDALRHIDLSAVGRFVRSVADPHGGFRSCPVDDAADVEYTYYGIGCLAILRAAAS